MNMLDESERLDRLVEKYPRVFAEATLPFGLQCGPGWDPLIALLCEQLDLVLVRSGKGTIGISQIKEKFGTLLFYYDPQGINDCWLQEISGVVELFQIASQRVCEVCGQPGRLRRKNWSRTLCESCAIAAGISPDN